MKRFVKRMLAVICTVAMLVPMMCELLTVSAANNPEYWRKPTQVSYVLERDDDGYAKGEITVRVNAYIVLGGDPYNCEVDAVMYWANANGPLEGYSALARFGLTTISTTYTFPELQIIPAGADRIRVYTAMSDSETLSTEYKDAMLPANAGYSVSGTMLNEFAVISDTHITTSLTDATANSFKEALTDLKTSMPDGDGIFINGDIINGDSSTNGVTTAQTQYSNVWALREEVNSTTPLYLAIGNHDLWPAGFVGDTKPSMVNLFCQNASLPNGGHPTALNYDFWIDNCHFIFLGDDDNDPNYATINATNLAWLDQKIAEGYDDNHKTFLFLHQSLSNTVAGGLTDFGEAWHGVQNVAEVRAVLEKYPDAIMFNSHSHYSLNSIGNAYYVDDYPTSFNTSSVKYADDHKAEGYIVQVYEDKVVVKGRDFTNGKWVSSAQYVVPFTEEQGNNNNNNNNGNTPTNNNPEYWRKPTKATYVLDDKTDGYAKGEITVAVNAWVATDQCKVDAIMYWANANGPLEGYSPIARFGVTTVSTTYAFPELQIIPKGADRIRVYTAMSDSNTLSTEYADAMLPAKASYSFSGDVLNEFAVLSDTHITSSLTDATAKSFKEALTDLKTSMPNGQAIFINGDIINGNQSADGVSVATTQYQNLWTLKNQVNPGIPMYLAIGNHDLWPVGFIANTRNQMVELFTQNAKKPDGKHPDSLTYDFWIDDCHFIFLGDDDNDPNYATINKEHLDWLDKTIAEGYDSEHKTFLFLHQSVSNTVAGGITEYGQADHGVQNVPELKAVLKKYPNAIMFNGHSHYPLSSLGNAYYVDNYPTSFNTSSVKYAYDHKAEGYIVRVYEDKVVVLGRDFTNGEWVSSAQYVVPLAANEDTKLPDNLTPDNTTPNTNPDETAPQATDPVSESEAANDGCGSVISGSAVVLSAIIALGAGVVLRKREE